MKEPENAGKYQVNSDGTVQGQIIGDYSMVHQHFYAAKGSTAPERLWIVPYRRNGFFTGRETLLTALHTSFVKNRTAVLTQGQAINGLGGIGKTQVAVEYAYRYQQEYRFILWASAATHETLISAFVSIADGLQLPERTLQEQDKIVAAVLRWLSANEGWLLIVDNADDLEMVWPLLPTGSTGHVLVTTRDQATGDLESFLVEQMDRVEGTELLLRRAHILKSGMELEQVSLADRQVSELIVAEMDGLPLALDQAGAYIEETKCDLFTYLERYRARRAVLLSRRGRRGHDHPDSVATTWSLSLQQIEQKSLVAADLLRLCAFLAPDAIPEEIVTKGASYLGEHLQGVLEDEGLLDEAIAVLRAYSLIRRDDTEKTLSIHRLVQAVLRDAMDKETSQRWANSAIQAVNRVLPDGAFDTWPQLERLFPHAFACVTCIEQEHISSQEAARLLNQTGGYLMDRGRYTEAEPILQYTRVMCGQVLGADHPMTASSLGNLAALYQAQGKYTLAESLAQQALTLLEQVLSGNYSVPTDSAFFLATTLNNLASFYQEQGKYKQAELLFVRAAAIWSHTFGPVHPHMAYVQNNLGSLYEEQGQYDDAEALYQQALVITEQMFGSNHPHIAICLNNISGIYKQQNRHIQAELLLTRALTICETELGPNHPKTATSLNNLAEIYMLQEAYDRAEPLLKRALTINEHVFGLHHSDVAISLNNLANLYGAQGKYTQAELLLKRALSICETASGRLHSEMVPFLINYAALLRVMKQDEGAEKLELRAKQLQEDRQQAVPLQANQQEDRGFSQAARWMHHDALDNLDRLWNLTEEALKRRSTEKEREKVYRFKQLLWTLLDDMANDTLPPLEHARIGQELEALLQQAPFVDLEERPLLNNIPGIGYVPDDFPFSSEAETKANYFWTQFSLDGSTSYTRFLALLRHFSYISLPTREKASLRKLREAIDVWRQDWLTGPLPPVHYNGPSETAKRVAHLLDREPFRKKHREIQELPLDELYKRLHPDDAQLVATFRRVMAERFEVVKDQIIADLKKLGRLP